VVTASTSASWAAVRVTADQRTIAAVQRVTRWLVVASLPLLALAAAAPAAAQESDTPTTACTAARPVDVEFVGRVTSIADEQVTYSVTGVRSGEVAGRTITVRYPTKYNAEKLEVGHSYLVPLVDVTTGASAHGKPKSYVDTAEVTACGTGGGTRLPDGSDIDTSSMSGIKPTLVRYGAWTAVMIAAVLVLLVLFGRFLDRRSRYRKPVRL